MEITDVRLRKVKSENRMKAVASVTIDQMDYLSLCLQEKLQLENSEI